MGSSQGFWLPSGDVVQPDHTFMSHERLRIANPEDGELLEAAPDLVVEVLSRPSMMRDRGEKRAIYERNNVLEYWLVDPLPKTLTTYALDNGRFGAALEMGETERYHSPALGLSFQVRALFPEYPSQ